MIWDDVRDRLNQGWVKGYRHTSDGKVCLLGAFEGGQVNFLFQERQDRFGWEVVFAWAEELYPKEITLLAEVIEKHPVFRTRVFRTRSNTTSHSTTIATFNNHPDTTLEDVLEAVNLAEAKQRGLGLPEKKKKSKKSRVFNWKQIAALF